MVAPLACTARAPVRLRPSSTGDSCDGAAAQDTLVNTLWMLVAPVQASNKEEPMCQMGNGMMTAGCYRRSWLEDGPGRVLGERQLMGRRRLRVTWRGSSRAAGGASPDRGTEPSLEVLPKKD